MKDVKHIESKQNLQLKRKAKKMMSKKVLGFKPRKAWLIDDEFGEIYSYTIDKSQLVPVVSLEWLEKWCKENQMRGHACPRNWLVSVKHLILAAKKEAEKTK